MLICIYVDNNRTDERYITAIQSLKAGLLLSGHHLDFIDFATGENKVWHETCEKDADAYVITPSGIAARAKFFQHFNLKDIGVHKKPVILYNFDGDFEHAIDHLDNICIDNGMQRENIRDWYVDAATVDAVLAAI